MNQHLRKMREEVVLLFFECYLVVILENCPGPQEFGSLRIDKNTFFNLNKCGKSFYFTLGEVIHFRLLEMNSEQSRELNKQNLPVSVLRDFLNLFPMKSPYIVFFSKFKLIVRITCDICKSTDFLDPISEILSSERDLAVYIFNTQMLFISLPEF